MIHGIHHLAVSTHDIDRFVDHYQRWFGFERSGQGSWEQGSERIDRMVGLADSSARYEMIRLGNVYIEVFEYKSPRGEPIRPRMCDPGFIHLCLYSDDVVADYERLKSLGMQFNCPPGGSGATRATYGRDCDGNVVELLQIVDPYCDFAWR